MLPFATTWMDLEDIILSEISQRKTNTIWVHLHEESKNKQTKQRKPNHRYREQLVVARDWE